MSPMKKRTDWTGASGLSRRRRRATEVATLCSCTLRWVAEKICLLYGRLGYSKGEKGLWLECRRYQRGSEVNIPSL